MISNVKLYRLKLGKTQQQLCGEVKMSPNTLVKVEKGEYDFLTLGKMKAIAEALNTTVQELFFSED